VTDSRGFFAACLVKDIVRSARSLRGIWVGVPAGCDPGDEIMSLEERIADVLREAEGWPLDARQLALRLTAAGCRGFDDFDVWSAVWRLVTQGRARFTPDGRVAGGESENRGA
jgi:hypothetical protein